MRLRAGRVLSFLGGAFLAFDGTIKCLALEPVRESFERLGYPAGLELELGLLELACLAAYALPRTAVLGAVLLTGYLGGAIATHLRAEDPLPTHTLFPLYVAAFLWGGLYLREERLHALLPLRKRAREAKRTPTRTPEDRA